MHLGAQWWTIKQHQFDRTDSLNTTLSADECCNIGHPSETHLKPKSRGMPYIHNTPIFHLPNRLEHNGVNVVLFVSFQNDLSTEMNAMDVRDFTRFKFEISFLWLHCMGWYLYLGHCPLTNYLGSSAHNPRRSSPSHSPWAVVRSQGHW